MQQTTDSDIEKILQTSRTLPDTKEDDEYNRVNREVYSVYSVSLYFIYLFYLFIILFVAKLEVIGLKPGNG